METNKKLKNIKIRRKYYRNQKDKEGMNKYYRHKYEIKIPTGVGN